MNPEEYQRKINSLGQWYHPVSFNKYLKTNSKYAIRSSIYGIRKWNKVIRRNLPVNLRGKSVLDIGCASGLYSILCAKEGANVVSVELNGNYCRQMELSMEIFSEVDRIDYSKRISIVNQSILEFEFEDYEKFDVVMALNMFYWIADKIDNTEFNNLICSIKEHCKMLLIQADENKYLHREKNNLSTVATGSKEVVNLLQAHNFTGIRVDKPINIIGLLNTIQNKLFRKYEGEYEIDIRNPLFYSRPIVTGKNE